MRYDGQLDVIDACPRKDVLDTSKLWLSKTTKKMKASNLQAASGHDGPRNDSEPLVELEDDGKSSRPGPARPGAKSYERGRTAAGGHLLFNVFWLIPTFCIFQMYMRDSLHQVDHGIVIHVLRGILRLFFSKGTKQAA
jgi:hypothetical protein